MRRERGSMTPTNCIVKRDETRMKISNKYLKRCQATGIIWRCRFVSEPTRLFNVPSGQTHPQNTLPKTIVRVTATRESRNATGKAWEARKVAREMRGSKSRKILT